MGLDSHSIGPMLDELAYYEGRAMARSSRGNKNPYPITDRRAAHWANGYASIAHEVRQHSIKLAAISKSAAFKERFGFALN